MVDRLNVLMVELYTRLRREEGQGAVEYALILAAIAAAVFIAAAALGTDISNKLSKIGGALPG